MHVDRAALDKAAATLLAAYDSRIPVPPLTASYPGLSADDAYGIQLAQVAAWTGAGRVVKGHKVGLTSAAMQRQLGVDQPDFGHLLDAMFLPEGAAGDTVSAAFDRIGSVSITFSDSPAE